MKRLRLVFGVLTIALLVPLFLIVQQTRRSIRIEQAQEHEAVANRIFEEMQRRLDEWLIVEEARSPGEYKSYFLPAGESKRVRSPLADAGYSPFVLGYFELDEKKRFQSPFEGAEAADRKRHRLVETLVAASWQSDTQRIDGPSQRGNKATVALKGKVTDEFDRDRRGVFESLRQIGSQSVRKQKRAPTKLKTPAQNIYQLNELSEAVGLDESPNQNAPAVTIDVNVDPMLGRVLDDTHLALYRTVWGAQGAVRQGVVLEVTALGSWLESETLANIDFAEPLRVLSGLDDSVGSTLRGEYVFQHQFLEPFGALRAAVALPKLPDRYGQTLGLLTLIVTVAATAGLYAAYRMVESRVSFAERRSNFVSAVTHELKTPLTVIRMYSEVLENDMLESEEKRREYYRTIGAESERLGRLINNVLELSKIERGTRQLDLVTGHIGSVLDEVLEMLRPHAAANGFTLLVDCAPDLPTVRYDRDALVQIVFNLVDNAMKYARKASNKTIQLQARAVGSSAEPKVALVVRDFGPGVSPNQLKRVFEPFFRMENELTRTSKGAGIGLALVKSLAEAMGGAVRASNAVDGGFEVTVNLHCTN